MKRKIRAFTLAESLTTLCVLGVVAVLTVVATANSNAIDEKQIFALSQSFYTSIESTYQGVLLNKVRSANIKNIDTSDTSSESEALKNLFAPYIDGDDINCSNLKTYDEESKSFLQDDLSCVMNSQGIVAGFYLDTSCDNNYQISEYLSLDETERKNRRIVENVCGYVLYASKKSKGIYGVDVFTIALGKSGIK